MPVCWRLEIMAKKDKKELTELIRRANDLINPEDKLAYLLRKDLRDKLYVDKPQCWLRAMPIGRDTTPYIFPMCTRSGIVDPDVIGVSLKMVQRLMADETGKFDSATLQRIQGQLQNRFNTLSKSIPKPATTAAKKAQVTRMFKNIKSYLDLNVRSDNSE